MLAHLNSPRFHIHDSKERERNVIEYYNFRIS